MDGDRPGRRLRAAVWTCVTSALLVGAAAAFPDGPTDGVSIRSTLVDFYGPGSQPGRLVDPLVEAPDCALCHGGYNEAQEPYTRWTASMMGQGARDPIFWAAMAIAEQAAPNVTDLCVRCHAPRNWINPGGRPSKTAPPMGHADEGISCSICHRMVDPVYRPGISPAEDAQVLAGVPKLPVAYHSAQFVLDPQDRRRGPFQLSVSYHEWLRSPLHSESRICGTCHDVSNPLFVMQPDGRYALDTLGKPHPTHRPYEEFPLERTYSEWSQSEFARGPIDMGGRFGGNRAQVSSCQDCHMPKTTGTACLPVLGGAVRSDLPQHDFRGATTWMLHAVRNLYPDGETGLTAGSVADAVARNQEMLRRASDVHLAVSGGSLTYQAADQQDVRSTAVWSNGRWFVTMVRPLGTGHVGDVVRWPLHLVPPRLARNLTMPTVHNWQLGREMEFPYEEHHPGMQFAFVFNINRCINCQTCTMACKSTWTFGKGQEHMWWNNVETKPFGGYPQHWDSKLLSLLEQANPRKQTWEGSASKSAQAPYGRFGGKTVFEAIQGYAGPDGPKRTLGYIPTPEEWEAPNIHEEVATGLAWEGAEFGGSTRLPEHKVWYFYLARLCNHCTYAACLAACPRQAIYKRPEDGIVLIDQSRCNGYQKCVEACPYKKSIFRPATGTSEKCVGCYPRIEGKDPLISPNGEPAETRCMTACVGKIRLQGLVAIDENGKWRADPSNPIYYLVRERQIALPLYPQFGTEPNGFYIPPRWVPRGYLEQMFGPGVRHAIEQYSCPDRELLAVLQLFRATQQIIFRFEIVKGPKVAEIETAMPDGSSKIQQIFNDTVIGYNKFNKEVVRITIEEPTFERPADIHVNSI